MSQILAGGIEPRVLVTSRQGSYGKKTVEPITDIQDRYRLVAPSTREKLLRRFRRFYVDTGHMERAIEQMVVEHGADLIHVHWSAGIGQSAANVSAKLGLPLVAEVRFDLAGALMSETIRIPIPGLERPLRHHFEGHLKQASAVIAAGDSLAAFIRSEYPSLSDRLYAVPNGVNSELFRPGPPNPELRAKLGLEGKFVIGTTSNMLRYEGLDVLIRALAKLQRTTPSIHALFVGAGTQAENLQKLAQRLGVSATFTGLVPGAEVPRYLRLIDLYVIPRRDVTITRHAGPIKLVEAMACGRAVVGSRLGDIAQLLSEGRGAVVEPESVQALTTMLATLYKENKTRQEMGRRAHLYAKSQLNWANAAEIHRKVYERVLNGT